MTTKEISEKINALHESGVDSIDVVMKNGEKQTLRLFVSTLGNLCYFAKGKRRKGYPICNIIWDIESVSEGKKKIVVSQYDKYLGDLKKFQKLFTTKLHPNLWSDIRKGYSTFNINEFEKMVAEAGCNKESHYDLYKVLSEYSHKMNCHIITENHYKLTTITSNAPKYHDFSYQACITNIANHLANKESFRYSWRSNYDVTVSGKLCDDGIYRAWLSLEYKNCGNGHYYLLVNENQAVFTEDD